MSVVHRLDDSAEESLCNRSFCDLSRPGIRKVRWGRAGTGKSGGVRVIYFSRLAAGELVLLTLYAKAKTDNLTGPKLKEIRRALEE